eukprot:jgi/Galph1/6016/GphlegSOOS_G4682.1
MKHVQDLLQDSISWSGTCFEFSVKDGQQLKQIKYKQSLQKVQATGNQSFLVDVAFDISSEEKQSRNVFRKEVFTGSLALFSDFSYSVDYKEVKFPFDVTAAGEVVELCIVVTEDTRLRCFVLYDFDYKLFGVFLLKENHSEVDKDILSSERLPLEKYCGQWVGRGSQITFSTGRNKHTPIQSSIRILWDGDCSVRKTMSIHSVPDSYHEKNDDDMNSQDRVNFRSQRWLDLRSNVSNTVTSYGSVVNSHMVSFSVRMEQNVLIFLPFSCFIQMPCYLHANDAFHFEFGCMIHEGVRKRLSRLYSKRGFPVSTTSILEEARHWEDESGESF